MNFMSISVLIAMLAHTNKAIEGQTSTWHYEICKVVVSEHSGDICNHKCIKSDQNGRPVAWGVDHHLDETETSETRKHSEKIRTILSDTQPIDQCNTLEYCVTYLHLHMCQTCGTPSIWHPSTFLIDNKDDNIMSPNQNIKRAWNGVEPEKYSMPWNVLIRGIYRNNTHSNWTNDKDGICGGTLIDETTVLTAAHCFRSHEGLTLKHVDLYFGNHEDDNLDDKIHDVGVQHRQVYPFSVITHEGFAIKDDDVAVIKLRIPVQISHMVSPACLPVDVPVDFFMRGIKDHKFVAGAWGKNEFGGSGTHYRQIVVQETRSDKHNLIMVAHEMNRNRTEKYKGVCKGDSGSGLMTIHDDKWIVAGFLHRGLECQLEARYQSAEFINVRYYLDWIKKRMGNGTDEVEN